MKRIGIHKSISDKEIVYGLLSDDEQMIRYLFYEKCSAMFSYIIKSVFNYHVDRDELINELYIYLKKDDWRKVRNFNYQSKFTTWLSVVAVRYFIQKRRSLIDSTPNMTPIDTIKIQNLVTTEQEDKVIDKIDLYSAISKLANSRERFVLIATYIEGRCEKDVAADLGINIANLYNIKSRAKKHLSNILTDK